jgi:hypothetical protein
VPEHVRAGVLGLSLLWITTFAIGTLLLSISNVGLVTSASAVAATLNNVGPGLELVGATLNYAPIAPWGPCPLVSSIPKSTTSTLVRPHTLAYLKGCKVLDPTTDS